MYLSGLVEVKGEVHSRCSSWWPSSLAAGWVSWPGWSWQGARWWSWSLWPWWQGSWWSWWLWLWWQGTWWSWWRFCRGFALFSYCVNFIYQQRSLSGIIVVAEVVFSGYSPLSVFTSGVLRSTTNIYNKYVYSKYVSLINIFIRQQWSLLKFVSVCSSQGTINCGILVAGVGDPRKKWESKRGRERQKVLLLFAKWSRRTIEM